jgi:integrase
MARDRLTDTKVRQAKPGPKPYKLADGAGLFLLAHPNGSKYWRLKYRLADKEKLFAIGVYPEVSLAQAREKALQARHMIREGGDPVLERRRRRSDAGASSGTFHTIAEEWIASRANEWAPTYREAVHSALAANLYPQIGGYAIRSITVPVMREALLLIERRGALAALRKVRMWASLVFRYATGRADADPAAPLRGTFKAHKGRNFAAVTKSQEFGDLIAKVRGYDGSPVTRLAMMLMAYTFVRTGELRGAEWSEFDLERARWSIPAERMKMGEGHIVPLSRQALEALSELKTLTGTSRLLFPNERKPNAPMSENTILFALYRLGYHSKATGHGFRSSASTLLNELGFDPDVIERQLAHRERNKVRAAYHRAEYLAERREMMQKWADYVDELATTSCGQNSC